MSFPCAAHLSKAFLIFSCKSSQANLSTSPSTSSVMIFHLLMLHCACMNLNVLGEVFFPRDSTLFPSNPFDIMDHLEGKLRCLELSMLVLPQPSMSHLCASCNTVIPLLGLIRFHWFFSSWTVISSLPSNSLSSYQALFALLSWLFHRLLGFTSLQSNFCCCFWLQSTNTNTDSSGFPF